MSTNKNSKITFDYDGVKYTLEYTAESLKMMERQGFKFAKIDDRILSAPEELFSGLFLAHHAGTSAKKRHEIYEALCAADEDGVTLADAIGEMLTEAVNAFVNRKSGNVAWRRE